MFGSSGVFELPEYRDLAASSVPWRTDCIGIGHFFFCVLTLYTLQGEYEDWNSGFTLQGEYEDWNSGFTLQGEYEDWNSGFTLQGEYEDWNSGFTLQGEYEDWNSGFTLQGEYEDWNSGFCCFSRPISSVCNGFRGIETERQTSKILWCLASDELNRLYHSET